VLRRIPVVARALAAPGTVSRLELPHAGSAFLVMALGHLPALFAVPAGLGDVAAVIAAPLVYRTLGRGGSRRTALWFNAFGLTDLVVALTLGTLTGFQRLNVTPSGAPISELPLALNDTGSTPTTAITVRGLSSAGQRRRGRAPAPRPGAALAGPADLEFRLEDDLPVLVTLLA
jgi:hypothetical protein